MTMHGLDLTYATLATTRNEAAIDVLAEGLTCGERAIRRRCLQTLMTRGGQRCAEVILERWEHLTEEDVGELIPSKRKFAAAIDKILRGGSGGDVPTAITATVGLGLNPLIPSLVELAESDPAEPIRRQATEAILELVPPLGRDARCHYDRPSERGPALARLAASVPAHPDHRSDQLLDAFLIVSTWSDRDLAALLAPESPHADALIERFAKSTHPAVIDLAAGFLRRRTLPEPIQQVLRERPDRLFSQRLLGAIGNRPGEAVQRNLALLGIPECCRGGEAVLEKLPLAHHAALAELYVAAAPEDFRTLELLAAVIARGGPGAEAAVARGLRRCAVPPADFWIQAAMPIAEGDYDAMERDDAARLLYRLIPFLDHHHAGLVQAVRHVLQPLHADALLSRLDAFGPDTRRRLGRVIRMVDPQAIECIEQALRHPLLEHRLQAITAAEAIAGVDDLAEAFAQLARHDHRQAKLRAVEALRNGSSAESLEVLRELSTGPENSVRDAATEAFRARSQKAPAKAAPAAPIPLADGPAAQPSGSGPQPSGSGPQPSGSGPPAEPPTPSTTTTAYRT